MKRFSTVFLLTLVLACSSNRSDPGTGDRTGGPGIELFGEGSVSTILPEFATTFSPGGDSVFFNRTPADRSRIDLLYSERTGEGWTDGHAFEPLEGIRAVDPFFSADGRRLYFSSNMPREGEPVQSFDLWFIERTPDGWGDPVALPEPINSDASDIFNSLSGDGTMVFSSNRDGVRRIYTTREGPGGWDAPEPVRFSTPESGSNPAISPDGRLMVLARPTEEGTADLFVSCRSGTGWDDPQRLPDPVNSRFTEFAPGFGPLHLYFTSERPGIVPAVPDSVRPPGDIYRTPVDWILDLCTNSDGTH